MSRISIVSIFLIVFLSHTHALAQVSPYQYHLLKSELSRLNPSDARYKFAKQMADQSEAKMRSMFRSMPAVAVGAIRSRGRAAATVRAPMEWRTKLELELRRFRIGIKSKSDVTVFIQVYSTGPGKWGGKLQVKEWVTLSRPGRPKMYSTTYESVGPYRKTQSEAEKDMWAAVDEFCLLHMKFNEE